ncbi:glycosyl hydrolase family 30 [Marinifilum sp. N1E240]|uniref:glycoside hydrolase family 30 protein n=1 Tax=Marinifilum sp. N1E240 TaxID=2608082 RepID=UPI00128D067C|nr:glycoside hydrolase family 30 protein [Marinifilum sp. N1E240]MPQ46700.1 glycosyl hydrolase family 30 [Marinifilum sp. N1E240]
MKSKYIIGILLSLVVMACNTKEKNLLVDVYETSASGNKLTKITEFESGDEFVSIQILPEEKYQEIIGFGGSFTESSAYLLNQMSKENRKLILDAYFAEEGAKYSLTRTHINSCDFSLSNYSYAPVEGDKELKHFSIDEDRDDIIPMIKEAMEASKDGFKILSSPWTASPWMKDNNKYVGGKLLPEYYDTWALFFSKYIQEYKKEGIDIWGLTVENEPLGNGNNWESMHFSPEEMVEFVSKHMGPKLKEDGHDVKILGYDQNRDELEEWADIMYKDEESSKYFDGMAIHWYASTYDYMPEVLQYTFKKAPNKLMIQSEACVDAEVPHWNDDAWYWKKEATDWGFDWAPDDQKHLHPKYVPVYRYARDIIGCLNNYVQAWIDWNMVLDTKGGPNWANNWCLAPVIVDPEKDEVYFTPMYYTLAHFSKYIRPDAVRIGFKISDKDVMMTAAKNPDGTIAIVILNMNEKTKNLEISLGDRSVKFQINAQAIQTVIVPA